MDQIVPLVGAAVGGGVAGLLLGLAPRPPGAAPQPLQPGHHRHARRPPQLLALAAAS